jgi:hypothetical protein
MLGRRVAVKTFFAGLLYDRGICQLLKPDVFGSLAQGGL